MTTEASQTQSQTKTKNRVPKDYRMPLATTYLSEGDVRSLVNDATDFDASAEKYGVGWLFRANASIIAYCVDYLFRYSKIRSKLKGKNPVFYYWQFENARNGNFDILYQVMDDCFSRDGQEHAVDMSEVTNQMHLSAILRGLTGVHD